MDSPPAKRPRSGWTIAWILAAVYVAFGMGQVNLEEAYLIHRANVGNPSDLSSWNTITLVAWPIIALAHSADMSMKNAAVPVPWVGRISLALLIGFAVVVSLVLFLWVRRGPEA